MDFLNNIGKKASEAYKITKEKTTKLSGEIKLKTKINDYKNKIEDIQFEIGKSVYASYKNGYDNLITDEISSKFEEIIKLENDIKSAEEEILSLKDIKKCVSCGAELQSDMEFCSKCGTKQPVVEKVETVETVEVKVSEEPQDAKEVEVNEVKDAENENNTESNNESNTENKDE